MLARGLLALLLTPYVGWLVFAYHYHFLDGVNLALHEGGHLMFAAFGQTLQVLGGTIGQLFFPIACAASFAHRKQIFEAAVCGVWAAPGPGAPTGRRTSARLELPVVRSRLAGLERAVRLGTAPAGQSRRRGIATRSDGPREA